MQHDRPEIKKSLPTLSWVEQNLEIRTSQKKTPKKPLWTLSNNPLHPDPAHFHSPLVHPCEGTTTVSRNQLSYKTLPQRVYTDAD